MHGAIHGLHCFFGKASSKRHFAAHVAPLREHRGEAAISSAARHEVVDALTRVLGAVCFAPLLVLPAGIVMQRIVALQRAALHELRSRKLLPIVMLL